MISSLAGCASGRGCPPLVTYSAAQQDRAAEEIDAQPKGSQLVKMVVDYCKFRDACRVGE